MNLTNSISMNEDYMSAYPKTCLCIQVKYEPLWLQYLSDNLSSRKSSLVYYDAFSMLPNFHAQ